MRKFIIINEQCNIIAESRNLAVITAIWMGCINDLKPYADITVVDSNLVKFNWLYPNLGIETLRLTSI